MTILKLRCTLKIRRSKRKKKRANVPNNRSSRLQLYSQLSRQRVRYSPNNRRSPDALVAAHGRRAAAAAPKRNISRPQPRPRRFLFNHCQPINRLLRRADSSRRLEPDRHSGLLCVFANAARHDQATGKVAFVGSLPVEVLMKSAPAIMGHHASPRHIAQRQQIAGSENYFHVSGSASLLERRHFVVKCLPASAKTMAPRDNYINLMRARLDRRRISLIRSASATIRQGSRS